MIVFHGTLGCVRCMLPITPVPLVFSLLAVTKMTTEMLPVELNVKSFTSVHSNKDDRAIGALVILNGEPLETEVLNLVWPLDEAGLSYPCICADGAANMLHAVNLNAKSEHVNGRRRIPSHITGDLDSVSPEVVAHFANLGTSIVEEKSEDSNDFHKSLKIAKQVSSVKEGKLPVIIIGGMAGRMDQTLGNINQLYCCAEQGLQAVWLAKRNLLCMLAPGSHKIVISKGSKCGLIPIGGAVKSITTTGLRWDMTNQMMAFGTHNLISTSNEATEEEISVQVSDPVLWTAEIDIA